MNISSRPTLSIVIPCFNEQDRITATVDEILRQLPALIDHKFEIILVDDGSTDSTVDVIEYLITKAPTQIKLIKQDINRGKGAAIRLGVSHSIGTHVLMTDADGSTPITEIRRLMPEALKGIDIVIGSRAIDDAEVTLKTHAHRKLLGRVFNGLVNFLVLPGVHDTQCGFKLFSRKVVEELFPKLTVDHFGFDIELLLAARINNFSVKEIAVNWHHVNGSKVNLLVDSAKMLTTVIRLFLYHSLKFKI